ncbi:response regulator [Caballeronia terrestris]|nr:response regulator [Caballeronia terrestris]
MVEEVARYHAGVAAQTAGWLWAAFRRSRLVLHGFPEVIIMDISIPDLNGFEATLALRRDLRTGNTIILAYTALDEADILRHLHHQMFDGYCQKGQSPDALIALIEHFTN